MPTRRSHAVAVLLGLLQCPAGQPSIPFPPANRRLCACNSSLCAGTGHRSRTHSSESRPRSNGAGALTDTPDWQVATNLETIAERVTDYCIAVDNLLLAQETVSDARDREKVGAMIREDLRAYYGPAIDAAGGREVAKAGVVSSGFRSPVIHWSSR